MNIKILKKLFINRTDCYAVQDAGARWRTVHEELKPEHVHAHLDGDITIGVHQINTLGKVKWLCYDFDGKHFTDHPKDTVLTVQSKLWGWYGLKSYIEHSGSPKSYHLWIFINLVDKQIALNFNYNFRERLKELGIDNKKVEKGAHGGTYGCMIRLPLGINMKNGNRSKFFKNVNLEQIEPQNLPVLEPPPQTTNCVESYSDIDVDDAIRMMKCHSMYMYSKYTAMSIKDRSAVDFVLTKYLIEHQVHPDVIFKVLLSTKWSKVHQRGRGREYFNITYDRALAACLRI